MKVFDESLRNEGQRAFLLGWAGSERGVDQVELEMDELSELVHTAGAEVVGSDIQRRAQVDPGRFFGSGKVEEVRQLRESLQFELVITNDDLSPRQQHNLEEALELPVLDRSALILDIFAQHARSREGRIQVEVAQLQHLIPRLTTANRLSRLGGGIGTRGPGEQKLETDRRRIRHRLRSLQKDLTQLQEERGLHRSGRRRASFRTVSVVGYTNAGKSTLLNALTAGGAAAENQLFATLDPRTRALALPSSQPCLMVDTVGFIQKLPRELIAAFHATLEEIAAAELIVHVLDASRPGAESRLEAVQQTLQELGLADRPMVLAINKADLISPEARRRLSAFSRRPYREVTLVSAVKGEGLQALRESIDRVLGLELTALEATIAYRNYDALVRWRRYGVVEREEFTEEGVKVSGRLPEAMIPAVRAAAPEPDDRDLPRGGAA